ncbi:hypothetical protein Glove_71g7 [Diversispora epigaea]|uniref:Uncharacterized protein n=1 Tax=Diversispora epigaea TaxID=1348612 RepID=A0A397JE41_9GLOM|nr:hypothetical protein Glove_71g7 [Diversispora epigaea]
MNVMNSLSLQKIESADEVCELLSQEVSRLQESYANCANECWKNKMIEFEKKGIRSTSFFQSSFQLLEEENEENLVVESADEVCELLSQEVSRLQESYANCANECWKNKMIEFEKKGIRSTSFFQSSFQLLEEENEENLVGPI